MSDQDVVSAVALDLYIATKNSEPRLAAMRHLTDKDSVTQSSFEKRSDLKILLSSLQRSPRHPCRPGSLYHRHLLRSMYLHLLRKLCIAVAVIFWLW